MDVVNEVERLWLKSHKRYVNAVLRDVGFLPIACKLCGGKMKSGFAVVVPKCHHSFHHDCFVDALKIVAPDDAVGANPQDAATAAESPKHAADGAGAGAGAWGPGVASPQPQRWSGAAACTAAAAPPGEAAEAAGSIAGALRIDIEATGAAADIASGVDGAQLRVTEVQQPPTPTSPTKKVPLLCPCCKTPIGSAFD